jgi:hypothetical protein
MRPRCRGELLWGAGHWHQLCGPEQVELALAAAEHAPTGLATLDPPPPAMRSHQRLDPGLFGQGFNVGTIALPRTMIWLMVSLRDPTSLPPPQVAEEGGVSVNLLAKILATLPRKPHGGVNLGPRESRW